METLLEDIKKINETLHSDLEKWKIDVITLNNENRNKDAEERKKLESLREFRDDQMSAGIKQHTEQNEIINEKLRKMVDDYSAFTFILDMKKKLAQEVVDLKQSLSKTKMVQEKEVNELKEELTKNKSIASENLDKMVQDYELKIQDNKKEFTQKLANFEVEKEEIEAQHSIVELQHKNQLQSIMLQHREEVEKLRAQIILMKEEQENDNQYEIFSQKFIEAKNEYERKFLKQSSEINDLKFELKESEDKITRLELALAAKNKPNSNFTVVNNNKSRVEKEAKNERKKVPLQVRNTSNWNDKRSLNGTTNKKSKISNESWLDHSDWSEIGEEIEHLKENVVTLSLDASPSADEEAYTIDDTTSSQQLIRVKPAEKLFGKKRKLYSGEQYL